MTHASFEQKGSITLVRLWRQCSDVRAFGKWINIDGLETLCSVARVICSNRKGDMLFMKWDRNGFWEQGNAGNLYFDTC